MDAAKQQQRGRRREQQTDSSFKKEMGTKNSDETTTQLTSILTIKTHQESITRQYAKKNTNLKRRVPNAATGLGNEMDKLVQDATIIKSGPKQKSASFLKYKSVTIREYSIVPGDNPSVSKGVPLTIDWDHQWERTFDLDAYEKGRKPRHQIEMKIPAELRSELLRKNGHSWKDIQASTKMANIARRQRMKTIERLPSDKIDEKLEKIARGVKNIFKEKKKKPDTTSGKEKKNDAMSGISNCAQVQDEEIHSKNKDDIDISLSKSAKKYDLSSLSSESREQKQPKQDLVFILSEDLSECQSMDEQSGISLGTSSVMEMKDHDQSANVTSSDRSDPSNDTSSTEDIDISNHSFREDLCRQEVDKNMRTNIPWFHSSMRTKSKKVSDREHKKKSRNALKNLDYGSEYNSEESENMDVEIDICCGGAFGRAGKLLQASRVKQDIF